jgi:DNA phosphorothioation-associated putative methyltransferase
MGKATSPIAIGKKVGGALYVHRGAIPDLASAERKKLSVAEEIAQNETWNVAKIARDTVSLLEYEDFNTVAFPSLLQAWSVDLATRRVVHTNYALRANPPILHRKELLLRIDDARRERFAALTKQAEVLGLFEDSHKIGTKAAWAARLDAAGAVVHDGQIVVEPAGASSVQRHKTALVRRDLSQPMALMLRWGVIEDGCSIFDYGCGQGDDVSILNANAFKAFGWDPFHQPDGPQREADVVNLGFVLNVIEKPAERVMTLKRAWSFAKKALTVSVMIRGKQFVGGHQVLGDGFLTTRGTFQKYYGQEELRQFVESALGVRTFTLAPGIITAFRDPDLEQEVIYRRRSRAFRIADSFQIPLREPRAPRVKPSLRERIEPELVAVWRLALSLGRIPGIEEFDADLRQRLSAARVSLQRAIDLAVDGTYDLTLLGEAAAARREDLLVHFALGLFPGAAQYTTLSRSVQRDVKIFFRNYQMALEAARQLLFSVGDQRIVADATLTAISSGLGGMVDEEFFRFASTSLAQLPTALRLVVGCAEVVKRDLLDADFIDVDRRGGFVRATYCEDAARLVPRIVRVVNVDLKVQRSWAAKGAPDALYLKGRYMPWDDPQKASQTEFDSGLLGRGWVTPQGVGPRMTDLMAQIRSLEHGGQTPK